MSASQESNRSEAYWQGYQDGKSKAWHEADEVNYHAWGNRVETAENELKQTRTELESLRRQHQDTQKNLRESQESVKALQLEMDKQQLPETRSRGSQCDDCPGLASCQAEVRQLRARVADLEPGAERPESHCCDATQWQDEGSQAMQNRIRELEDEKQATHQNLVNAEQELQDTQAELRRLKDHNCRLEAELRLTQRRRSSPDGEEQSLESELNGLEEQQKSPESDKNTSQTTSETTSSPSGRQNSVIRLDTYADTSEENESHIARLLDRRTSYAPTYGLAPALAGSRRYGGRRSLSTSRNDNNHGARASKSSDHDYAAELKSCRAELEIFARLVKNLRESIAKNDLLLHKAKEDMEVVILTAQEIRTQYDAKASELQDARTQLDAKASELKEIKARQEQRHQQKKNKAKAAAAVDDSRKAQVKELQDQVNELWTTLDTRATELARQVCEMNVRAIQDLRTSVLSETGYVQETCEALQSTGSEDALVDNSVLLSRLQSLFDAVDTHHHHHQFNDSSTEGNSDIANALDAEIEQMRGALAARQACFRTLVDNIIAHLRKIDTQHCHETGILNALIAKTHDGALARHASLLKTLQDPA